MLLFDIFLVSLKGNQAYLGEDKQLAASFEQSLGVLLSGFIIAGEGAL